MKKQLLPVFILFLFLGFSSFNAEAQSYEKGTKVVNLGIGFGGYYSGYGFGAPGVSASMEVGMWPTGTFGVIGIGGYVGARFGGDADLDGINYFSIGVGPRGTYHFTVIPVEKLDVYAALQLMLSFHTVNYDDDLFFDDDYTDTDFYPAVIAGIRYYFNDNIAVFGELGYNLTFFTAGVSFKF